MQFTQTLIFCDTIYLGFNEMHRLKLRNSSETHPRHVAIILILLRLEIFTVVNVKTSCL
jgi:hypothetical protein